MAWAAGAARSCTASTSGSWPTRARSISSTWAPSTTIVTDTVPAIKGATANAQLKPATLERLPEVSLVLKEMVTTTQVEALLANEIDLGLLRDLGYYTGAILEVYDPARAMAAWRAVL